MAKQSNEYDTNILGGLGEKYNRLIALRLLTRATFKNRPFKLAIEFKAGDKFDDVAFYDEAADEWWLFQAKHSVAPKNVSWEEMFPEKPTKGDFQMAKYCASYLRIRQHWRYGGKKVKLFIFTNNRFHDPVKSKTVLADEMLQFSVGEHFQLLPQLEDIALIKNHICSEICDPFVRLFVKGDGRAVNILANYPKLVSQVLTKDGRSKLRFSENFLQNNPKSQLYDALKTALGNKDMTTLSANAPAKLQDFWSGTTAADNEPFVDDDMMRAFFQDLVLSVSQPNVKRLAQEIRSDWNRWMRQRIRPDVLRRMTADQLKEPFNTFEMCFEEWEQPYEMLDNRRFLTYEDGVRYLEIVKDKLDAYVQQYDRLGYVGLDAVKNYYVDRWLTFGKRQETSQSMKDFEFVEWLCEDCNDKQCIALIAEPGMGKSTLWQHLAFCAQKKYEDVDVFLIYLNDLTNVLQTVDEDTTIRDAVKILRTVISDENIEPLSNEQRKIIMFMDAFDELRDEDKPPILKLINILLKNRNNIKVLISSRQRSQEDLETIEDLKIVNVVPFDDSNRFDFLRLFWKVEATTKFEVYSKQLLRKFERDMPQADIDFIGLPLTMKMLAEVFKASFVQYMETPTSTKPKSLLPGFSIGICFLYERFTRKCIALSLNKKWKLDINDAEFDEAFHSTITSAGRNYQLFAMEQMELGDMLESSQRTHLDRFLENVHKKFEQSLLLRTIDGTTQFTHRSYAEFFCAKYLYDQLGHSGAMEANQLDKCMQRTVVRIFLFKMLENNTQGSTFRESLWEIVEVWSCVDNNVHFLSGSKNVDKIKNINGKATTLLHIAAEWNACRAMEVLLKSSGNVDVENMKKLTPLCAACERGHLDMVQLLVCKGADVNHRLGKAEAPLYRAIHHNHSKIVDFLVSNGAKVDHKDDSDCIPLHKAAEWGDSDIVRLLCRSGATIEHQNSNRETALHCATIYDRKTTVEELLNCGANVNAQDNKGRTALHIAAGLADPGILQLLLSKQVPVDLESSTQETALHHAAYSDRPTTIQELLKHGANIDAQNKNGDTALHLAVERENVKSIRLLLEKGAATDLRNTSLQTALDCAVARGTKLIVDELFKVHGGEANAPPADHLQTALQIAIENENLESVRTLMANGVTVDFANWSQERLLRYAAFCGRTASVAELLGSGANINAQDRNGQTALLLAVQQKHLDVVSLLIERRAAPNIKDSQQATALHYAVRNGTMSIVEKLLESEVDVNAQDHKGHTALHIAAQQKLPDAVRLLIKNGAGINIKDSQAAIALHYAVRYGSIPIVEELLKNGANVNAEEENGISIRDVAEYYGHEDIINLLDRYQSQS